MGSKLPACQPHLWPQINTSHSGWRDDLFAVTLSPHLDIVGADASHLYTERAGNMVENINPHTSGYCCCTELVQVAFWQLLSCLL